MKKIILLTIAIFILTTSIFSQTRRVDVIVHMKDGSTVEGMINVNDQTPWSNQKSISVFDKSLVDAKRIKKKQKTKYKASKIKGYEAEGKFYESKKLSVTGTGEYGGGGLSGLPDYALIEKVEEGAITVYKGYGYPPKIATGVTFEEIYEDIRTHPEYFVMKKGKNKGKPKTMMNINVEKWISDAPRTKEQFENGEFGNFKRKKKKKLGNFLKGQLENGNPALIIKVVKAYNEEKAES